MATINIPHGVLRGNYILTGDETVNGPGSFAPDTFADAGNVTINAAVLGGAFTAGTFSGDTVNPDTLTFTNFVSPGVTADLLPGSTIIIDHPQEFHGTIGLISPPGYSAPAAEFVELVGLANADEFSVKNDLVTIRSADGKPIDRLHLSNDIASRLPDQPYGLAALYTQGGNVYLALDYGILRLDGGGATLLHQV